MTFALNLRLVRCLISSRLPVKQASSQLLVAQRCMPCCQCASTARYVKPKKSKALSTRKERHFVDYVELEVCGGKGGNGMLSFLSIPHREWAGPDGGDGGHGGHVIFKASHNTKSLSHLRILEKANDGVKGKTKHRHGKNALHRYIDVPEGTVIRSDDGSTLASLDTEGDMFVAARGGAGGKGNHFFLTNENRAPAVAEVGAEGQSRLLTVELKTMADFGLIGFPNAGKSTLLRTISRARPAVSAYPFTTLNPHVGMILYDDCEQIAVADIPGLIPGAHQNKGLGLDFLRHVERCLCLVYVLDLGITGGLSESSGGKLSPQDQLASLRYELECYQPGLSLRPAIILLNKVDLPSVKDKLEELKVNVEDEWRRYKGFSSETGTQELNLRTSEVVESPQCCDSVRKTNQDNDSGNETENSDSNVLENSDNCYKDSQVEDVINVLGVSAKQGIGIEELLHKLRVTYDLHHAHHNSV